MVPNLGMLVPNIIEVPPDGVDPRSFVRSASERDCLYSAAYLDVNLLHDRVVALGGYPLVDFRGVSQWEVQVSVDGVSYEATLVCEARLLLQPQCGVAVYHRWRERLEEAPVERGLLGVRKAREALLPDQVVVNNEVA